MRTAIIGGAGRMGQWLAGFLSAEGHRVTLIDADKKKLKKLAERISYETSEKLETASSAELIILSVPIKSFSAVAQGLSPFVKSHHIVLDITSIKAGPVRVMGQYLGEARLLGTHPLFGPGARGLRGQNVVLTPINSEELVRKAELWLGERGAKVKVMAPEEHDELMSIVLGLSHFIAFVAGDTLVNLEHFKDTLEASSTTYRLLLTLIGSVVYDDAGLYSSLQLTLPGLADKEALFLKKAAEWAEVIKRGDEKELIGRIERLKAAFEQDIDLKKSYQDMYRIGPDI